MLRPRIQLHWYGIKYKTGTGQRWTNQYTWEDYVVLNKWFSPMTYVPRRIILWNMYAAKEVSKYFEQHPEILLKAEPFKGLSLEEIKLRARYINLQ